MNWITSLQILISHCEINQEEFLSPLSSFLFKGLLFFLVDLYILNMSLLLDICITIIFSFWKLSSHLNCILLHQLYGIGYLKVLTRLFRDYSSKALTKGKVREFLDEAHSHVTHYFIH